MEIKRYGLRYCSAGGSVKAGLPDLALNIAKYRMGETKAIGTEILISECQFHRRNLLDSRMSSYSI